MQPKPPFCVIFDMDDTIFHAVHVWRQTDINFLAEKGFTDLAIYDSLSLSGKSLRDGAEIIAAAYGFDGDPELMGKERLAIAQELYKQDEVRFIDGFQELYQLLKGWGIPMAIATAADNALVEVLDARFGIREMFDGKVFTIADVGMRSKPDPAVFLLAAAELGVDINDPEELARVIGLEDSNLGVRALADAGMFSVGITTRKTTDFLRQEGAVWVVNNYREMTHFMYRVMEGILPRELKLK